MRAWAAAEQEQSKVRGNGWFKEIKVKRKVIAANAACVQIIEKFAVVLATVDALEHSCTLLHKHRGFRGNQTGTERGCCVSTMNWRKTNQKTPAKKKKKTCKQCRERAAQLGGQQPVESKAPHHHVPSYRALPLCEECLTKRKRVLGEDHPDTLISLNNLAGLFERKGEYDRALPLYEECLAKRKRVLGEDHPDTKSTQRSRIRCADKHLSP